MLEQKLEAALIEFCAPTLMGLKPAGLFRCGTETPKLTDQDVRCLGRELAPFGLALRILHNSTDAALVYLYRAAWLRQILSEPAVGAFLGRMGYPVSRSCAALLEHLRQRLRTERDFPHEIGVFLGYPLEDVVGFIENHGRNYTCCGCWKAYGDPGMAEARFAGYRQCTVLCRARYRNGANITQLIVA